MAEEKAKKVNNASKYISKDVIVIAVVLIAIAAYIIAECYSATHVDIQTVTAVKSTVYQTLDKKALVIRDEHTVEGNSSGVTVACVNDGEKVKVGGNIAMVFSNSDNAKSYSSALDLQSRLDYYINLESKSAGTATDVEQIDSDVINDVNDYIRSSSSNNFSAVQSAALDLNDKLTRRQMIIGEDIDFSIRIFKGGYTCRLFPDAWVYHKRRTDLKKFFKQVHNSGIARINLYKKYPDSLKLVHLLPAVFTLGVAVLLLGTPFCLFSFTPILLYALLVCIDSTIQNKSLSIGIYSIAAAFIQLIGYGTGFWRAWWQRCIRGKDEFEAFQKNFYK